MRTASPRARCRRRCVLSSREVKSTGEKFFVVILPSTVIANVTATNGSLHLFLFFFFGDLMLERGEFLLHLAHFHMPNRATWPIEEIDDAARQAAEQDHGETGGTTHAGEGRRDGAEIEQHHLQDEFA